MFPWRLYFSDAVPPVAFYRRSIVPLWRSPKAPTSRWQSNSGVLSVSNRKSYSRFEKEKMGHQLSPLTHYPCNGFLSARMPTKETAPCQRQRVSNQKLQQGDYLSNLSRLFVYVMYTYYLLLLDRHCRRRSTAEW